MPNATAFRLPANAFPLMTGDQLSTGSWGNRFTTPTPPSPPFSSVFSAHRSALRLEADVDRAVRNLENRIRRLLSAVAGVEGEAGSAGSSPTVAPATRRSVAAAEARGAAEIETYSV